MPRQKVRTEALRDEIVRRATELLERDGLHALRARQVAAEAGTSTAALYELFGDKAGLIRAVFFGAFQALDERLAAVPTTDDPRADLVGTMAAARAFALERPMLFDLMYSRRFGDFAPDDNDRLVGSAVYELVVGRVRRWLAAAGSATDAVDAAHALVALDRGLIATELAGMLGRGRPSRDRRWRLAVDAQLDGLAGAGRGNAVGGGDGA